MNLFESTFLVSGILTNFDAATRTLQGGAYELGGYRSRSTFQSRGADIVRNGAMISLYGGAMLDELGNNALRNLTEIVVGGGLILGPDEKFTARGSFTNAGRIETRPGYQGFPGTPTAASEFTVPPGLTFTQTAGALINLGLFTADSLQIGGGVMSGYGTITGNVTIGDATVYPGGVIDGSLTLSPESTVRIRIGEYSSVSAWRYISGDAVLAGTIELEIGAENFFSSSRVLTLLQSARPISGSFANAPEGTRLTSIDGLGSFVVRYRTSAVELTEFRANPAPAQLFNLSTRGFVRTADDPFGNRYLIGGFIITGTEAKTVVVRGLGPSLTASGVGSAIANPTIELRGSGSALVASNDNWRDTQEAEIEASGLAPQNPLEAAIRATLLPGAYTVVLQEKDGTAGASMVEVYDLTPNVGSKLANISTRGYVTPEDVLIGGLIARGDEPGNAELVVRAIGPQLRRNGVFSALDDPTLELRDANGGLIAFKDDAGDGNPTLSIPQELRPSFPVEPAIRVSVPRGNYTAIVRGKNGSSGTALVEFYDLRR